MGSLDLSAENLYTRLAAAGMAVLVLLLVASFVSRSRVFCQYLKHMTGIELRPRKVRQVYRATGKGGVRDLLMDLLIAIRADARKNKDFATADRIRNSLAEINVTLEDRPGGTEWSIQ